MNAAPFVCSQRRFKPRVLKPIHDDIDRASRVLYRVENRGDALVRLGDQRQLPARRQSGAGNRTHRGIGHHGHASDDHERAHGNDGKKPNIRLNARAITTDRQQDGRTGGNTMFSPPRHATDGLRFRFRDSGLKAPGLTVLRKLQHVARNRRRVRSAVLVLAW